MHKQIKPIQPQGAVGTEKLQKKIFNLPHQRHNILKMLHQPVSGDTYWS